MELEIEAVLNTSFGGFSLNEEMAQWLVENKKWTILNPNDYSYKETYPVNYLLKTGNDNYYSPTFNESLELRSHPDLIECVKSLQTLHENDSFQEKYYGKIFSLKVKKVKINIEIEDYHDGKERLTHYLSEI